MTEPGARKYAVSGVLHGKKNHQYMPTLFGIEAKVQEFDNGRDWGWETIKEKR